MTLEDRKAELVKRIHALAAEKSVLDEIAAMIVYLETLAELLDRVQELEHAEEQRYWDEVSR